ncbi:MAG TPA: hypothetical protein VNY80_01975 [Steroidobacteraceae bacterium]|nr:hypothetical protein [Steroidobacteraceae bacterium]
MSKVIGKRTWLVGALAVAAILSAQGAARPLAAVIEAVTGNGINSQLPAHLSLVLGIGRGDQKTPVKQAVIRDGHTVRTFNVGTADRDTLVIINSNEETQLIKAYLTSATGELRKAVYYQAGGEAHERSAGEARSDFAVEIKFWTNLKGQSKPAGEPR